MILRELPDLPPRPLTPHNAAFRQWFAQRWGRENAVVMGAARHIEFPEHRQTLSIKRAWGGDGEEYLLPRRRVRVDEHHCMIINDDESYGACIRSRQPVLSMGVFFRRGLAEEVAWALSCSARQALDEPQGLRATAFAEHLRPVPEALDRALAALRDAVLAGRGAVLGDADDEAWLEERLQALMVLMLRAEPGWRARSEALADCSRSNHAELTSRLDAATDFMISCHTDALTLDDLAAVARLSKFHFVRLFRRLQGLTPMAYLGRLRLRTAQRLMREEAFTLDEVAARSGLGSRQTLYRQLRRHAGGPAQNTDGRASAAAGSASATARAGSIIAAGIGAASAAAT